MSNWQPISAAPKDGTEILASDFDAIDIILWDDFEKRWRNRDYEYFYPHGWQPLPDHSPLPWEELNPTSQEH